MAHKFSNVDEWLAVRSPSIVGLVRQMESLVLETLPEAGFGIKFGAPFFIFRGLLCYPNILKRKNGEMLYIGFCQGRHLEHLSPHLTARHLKQIRYYFIEDEAHFLHSRAELQMLLLAAAEYNLGRGRKR